MSTNVATACRDIGELSPLAQTACNLFLSECKKQGLNIFITETYRSQDRQNYLYALGRTEPGKIVTWTRNSRHTSRLAWDIACKGANLYNNETLSKAGQIAAKLGITWGGNWDTPDRPHFEISKDWKAPKEETEMPEKRYNTIAELPEWAKPTIQHLVNCKKIADGNKLDLSMDMIRILVMMNR